MQPDDTLEISATRRLNLSTDVLAKLAGVQKACDQFCNSLDALKNTGRLYHENTLGPLIERSQEAVAKAIATAMTKYCTPK
jgi:hypothetical protein